MSARLPSRWRRTRHGGRVLVLRLVLKRAGKVGESLVQLLGEGEAYHRMRRNGILPVRIVSVDPAELYHQRPVLCEMMPVNEAVVLGFMDAFFRREDGRPDWRVVNSVHFRFLRDYVAGTLPQDWTRTEYWNWFVAQREAGIPGRDPERIRRKMRKTIAVYESMRRSGYRLRRLSDYVWVVEEPLILTRYGIPYQVPGLEIVEGHHRAVAAAFLGIPRLDVLVVRDVATHTPFGIPLDKVRRTETVRV